MNLNLWVITKALALFRFKFTDGTRSLKLHRSCTSCVSKTLSGPDPTVLPTRSVISNLRHVRAPPESDVRPLL